MQVKDALWFRVLADGSGREVDITIQDGGHGHIGAEDGWQATNIKHIFNVEDSKEALNSSRNVSSSLGTDPDQANVIIQTLNNLRMKIL